MKNSIPKWLWLAPIVVVIAACVGAAWWFLKPTAPDPPVLPAPNAYDDFVQAGQQIGDSVNVDIKKLGREDLAKIVSSNSAALALFRSGLEKECLVPVEYSMTYMDTHMPELTDLKKLARLGLVEGRLAELDKRYGDAAQIYCDIIKLGHRIMEGGLLIDGLVGIACQTMGQRGLSKIIDKLSTEECDKVVQVIDGSVIDHKLVRANEERWSKAVASPLHRIATLHAIEKAIAGPLQNIEKHQGVMLKFREELKQRISE
jgi:hypothetical protein